MTEMKTPGKFDSLTPGNKHYGSSFEEVRKFSQDGHMNAENIANQNLGNNMLVKKDDSNLDASSNKGTTVRSVRRTIQLSQDFSLNAKRGGDASERAKVATKGAALDLKKTLDQGLTSDFINAKAKINEAVEEKNGGDDFDLENLQQIKDTAHELIKLPLPPK